MVANENDNISRPVNEITLINNKNMTNKYIGRTEKHDFFISSKISLTTLTPLIKNTFIIVFSNLK